MSRNCSTSIDTIEAKFLHDREHHADSFDSNDPSSFPVNGYYVEKIQGRWTVSSLIGSGAYGEVYQGFDSCDNSAVAIKMEDPVQGEELKKEQMLYELLWKGQKELVGFPKIYHYGEYEDMMVLVMECLRSSIYGWMNFSGGRMSRKSVFMVGLQMIDRLEYMHNRGIIHRDIKPQNILIGNNGEDIYLVDLGLATEYIRDGEHITQGNGEFVGTPDYASKNAHLLKRLSRRDDLESLGYSLIHMSTGKLPWLDVVHEEPNILLGLIGQHKEAMDADELSGNMGMPMIKFFEHIWTLSFEDQPDYNYLRTLLSDGLTEMEFKNDKKFDWSSVIRQ